MIDLQNVRTAAVVAPHPDDEVLGCGGTIARLVAAGVNVQVVVLTRGKAPRFDEAWVETIRAETQKAHGLLGVAHTHFLDLPAAELDQMAQADVNAVLSSCLDEIAPDLLFVPFVGDIHVDHQIAFGAAMVWARPRSHSAPAAILAYETLSETNWLAPGITPAFTPNCYFDIESHIDRKVAAFECFESQVKPFPDERSAETIRAQAKMRGSTVHKNGAEAFMVVRISA
jgi:LmbE family N-acetylglucosaminyl deacetylase